MFLHDDSRYMLNNSFYCWLSIDLGLLVNILEMIDELHFNFSVIFNPFPLLILDLSDGVMHPPLYISSVKQFCITLILFEPYGSGFFLPEDLISS